MNQEKTGTLIEADILIIGGGIGGHTFAITAKEKNPGLEVAIVEKAAAGKTGPSALVGGRYGAFLPETDDFDSYFKAEVEEQDYLCDQEKIEDHLNNSGAVFRNLERWGVRFVKGRKGEYERPLSRGYHGGTLLDGGGIPAMQALNSFARKIGVKFYDRIMVTDLIASADRAHGAVGFGVRDGNIYVFSSKITVLATGMTRFKTIQPGHRNDTGDGYAMAYRAGAELGGFDSTHHNTYGARQEVGPGNNLYVGLGGYFLNARGERFMHKYHPELAERAPFVWLSPSFCIERMEGRAPPIHLDLRHFTPEKVQALWKSVPYAMIRYQRAGILKGDRFVQPVEYTPEGPRPMPCGVVTTRNYESRSLAGLFAIGDASAQKGAGGLSGAAVSAATGGSLAAGLAPSLRHPEVDPGQAEELAGLALAPLHRKDGIEPAHVILAIQEAIHPYYVGIIRHEKSLRQALKEIEHTRDHDVPLMLAYDPHYLMLVHEARNMALCAEMFLHSALARKESRLGRLREDYRELDNLDWLKYIHLKQDNGKMKVWTEEAPLERYRLKPKRDKSLHPFWKRLEELGFKAKVEDGNGH